MSEDSDDWSEKTDMTRIEDLSDFLHEEDPELDEKLEESEKQEQTQALDKQDAQEDESSYENGPDEEIEAGADFLTENSDYDEDNNFEESDGEESFDDFEEVTQPNFELPPNFAESDTNSEDDFESDDTLENENEEEEEEDENLNKNLNENLEEDNLDSSDLNNFDYSETSETENNEDQDEIQETSKTPLDIPPSPDVNIDQVNNTHKTQENFQDLRDYGNAISYGNVTTGGNPPFSIILRNIIYKEDAEDIFSLLKEFGVVTSETELTTKQGLESGSLLISQISEYSAIFLAHKFRRFNLEIRIGLSEQLHHSKSYEGHGKGLVTKDNIHQNVNEEIFIKHKISDVKDIILVTTANLNDFDIHRYLEIITSHTLISQDQLDEIDSEEISYHASISGIYKELANQLKIQAFKIGANAVTGINYSLTPLPVDKDSSKQLYKVTCFGNAVLAIFKST